jgi:hypothetical protein
MENSVIFCVDSYYQLMVSINLKMNKYTDDQADVVLFNTMHGAETIYKNLKESGLFRNVFLANTQLNKTVLNSSRLERIPKYISYLYSMAFYTQYTKKVLGIQRIESYNRLFFYGYRPLIQCIFNACKKANPELRCFRMDDGMGTYMREWNLPKPKARLVIERVMNRISGFLPIEENIDGFYVPDRSMIHYRTNYEILELPNYTNPNLIHKLNEIFDYKENKSSEKDIELVYFGVYGEEWIKRDIEYLKAIAKIIPKERIMIKIHPREDARKYRKLGIEIMEQSKIPWEIFMMNKLYSKATFVGQISSAILSSRVIFQRTGKDIYLYKCRIPGGSLANIDDDLNSFLQMCKNSTEYRDQIFIPESFDELQKALMVQGSVTE